MAAVKVIAAFVLWALAAASAGLTGAFFEESKILHSEGNTQGATGYTLKSIGTFVCALALVGVGVWLVRK